MGYLFEIFQSIQEKNHEHTELTNDEQEPSSLIELISRMERSKLHQDDRNKTS